MSDAVPPTVDPNLTKAPLMAEEVSLEDLDKLLEEEDPEFSAMLAEVRSVEVDTSIDIESSVSTDDSPVAPESTHVEVELEGFEKYKHLAITKVKTAMATIKAAIARAVYAAIQFLKALPKRTIANLKVGAAYAAAKAKIPILWIKARTRFQQLALFATVCVGIAAAVLFFANLKGVWLPHMNDPITQSLARGADHEYEYDAKAGTTGFYSAFPQENHDYLFSKIKVNLVRSADHPNPMVAMELIISVDSNDTAIELGSREIEFYDLIQRTLEGESYESMVTDLGKRQFKAKLKRELTQHLTQGWVKDILFKTVVLKP